jgi:N-acetylmuramoyl-L-alanine amidase
MRRLIQCGVLLALAMLASGCLTVEPVQTAQEIPSAPSNAISVQQLASRLGLAVEEDSAAMVTLRNGANRVMVLPDPAGQAYVNGLRVGPEGGFMRVGSVLYVPESLEAAIRSALNPAAGAGTHARTLKPSSTPSRAPLARAFHVVVDAGHGGKDPGTTSRGGIQEKSVTLPVAREVARLLKEDGFAVAMTRQRDVFIELDERAAIANRFAADLFVSIHADACPDSSMRGFAVYTSRETSTASRAAAEAVTNAMDGTEAQGLGMRRANYRVLVATECPAILVELGYLSNSLDAKMLASHEAQMKLARCIAEGIGAHFRR